MSNFNSQKNEGALWKASQGVHSYSSEKTVNSIFVVYASYTMDYSVIFLTFSLNIRLNAENYQQYVSLEFTQQACGPW